MATPVARFSGSLTLLAALFAVLFVGAGLTAAFYASAERHHAVAAPQRSLEEASRLARSGLELALTAVDTAMLTALPEGADTVLFRARSTTPAGADGSFEVRGVRQGGGRVELASTGTLAGRAASRCTVRLGWEPPAPPPQPGAAADVPCVAEPEGGTP